VIYEFFDGRVLVLHNKGRLLLRRETGVAVGQHEISVQLPQCFYEEEEGGRVAICREHFHDR
jgi:hypothetical protein